LLLFGKRSIVIIRLDDMFRDFSPLRNDAWSERACELETLVSLFLSLLSGDVD